jgi:signal transduction histidine kinase
MFYSLYPGVLNLNKRWVLYVTVLALFIFAFYLLLFVNVIDPARIYYNNADKLQQLQKNIYLAVVTTYVFILLFLAIVIISVNMGGERNAEAYLPNSLKVLEATINAAGEGILVVDINKKVLKANELCFKMWDIPSDMHNLKDAGKYLDLIKKRIKDPDAFEAWVDSSFDTCAINHYVTSLTDGRIIDIISNPLMDNDSMAGRVWCFKDITAIVNAENELEKSHEEMRLITEAREYDKIKTEFFANMSHEIKTPLNIIIGTLQLIELDLNNENSMRSRVKLAEHTAIMRKNCYRLLRMLNNLIYITEIDSGYVEMHAQNNDLVRIIKDTVSSVEKFLKKKEIRLELNIEPDSLKTACDADKIERVLLNLISNAVKFTENGGIISVSLYERNQWAYISVKDTGIGIPGEMKDLIFQRFRQVDKSFTRKCEGTGIGLSLVKSLVEMHGGTIEVQSEYGKGSEFIVKLPLRQLADDEAAAAAEEKPSVFVDKVNIEFSDIY